MTVRKMGPLAGGTAWADLLGSFANFVYFPYTDWTRMWEQFYSPRFYFGCNVADADTEHQVLDEVGSYGSQLNIVLDAAVVFVQHIPPADLSDDERKRVRALVDLMDRADRASAQFQGKPPQMLPLLLADWLHRPAPGSRTKAGAASAAGGASSNAG